MLFEGLHRDFSAQGYGTFPDTKEISKNVSPLGNSELLVKNDLNALKSISVEIKQRIKFLFILAHPDDEATHLIYLRILIEMGFPVEVVWLSYGDGSTEISEKISESRKVLSSIPGIQFEFLPNSVKELVSHLFERTQEEKKEMLQRLIGQVREKIAEASVVVTNAFEGGHLLHDLTHVLSRTIAAMEGKEVLEIPQYSLKTLKDIYSSAKKASNNKQWGSHIFYNVSAFREGPEENENLSIEVGGQIINIPTSLKLTHAGIASKAALIRLYQSQWEKVFSHLLGIVEFNETEDREQIRKVRKIPGLYSTLMHWEKIIKSWFGKVVHPKKLYRLKKDIEDMVKNPTAQNDLQLPSIDQA